MNSACGRKGSLSRKPANAPLSHAPLSRLPEQVCGSIPPSPQAEPPSFGKGMCYFTFPSERSELPLGSSGRGQKKTEAKDFGFPIIGFRKFYIFAMVIGTATRVLSHPITIWAPPSTSLKVIENSSSDVPSVLLGTVTLATSALSS